MLGDDREVIFQRRGFHAGIDAGETAADIDHVDHRTRLCDHRAHAVHRLDIGERAHRLAADVEADAQPVAMLAGQREQFRRLAQFDAEFGGERQLRIFAGNAQAHQQAQVLRRFAVIAATGIDDLFQLLDRIETEGLYAMRVIGLTDRARGLDRVHEAQRRLRQRRARQPHLGNRGDIVMGDAVVPQDLQQFGRRVRLHRIERLAGEFLAEESCSTGSGVRSVEDDRLVRLEIADYRTCVRVDVQLKGPPKRFLRTMKRQAALRLGSPLGAAGAAHIIRAR